MALNVVCTGRTTSRDSIDPNGTACHQTYVVADPTTWLFNLAVNAAQVARYNLFTCPICGTVTVQFQRFTGR